MNIIKNCCILGKYSRNLRVYPEFILEDFTKFEKRPVYYGHYNKYTETPQKRNTYNIVGHTENVRYVPKVGLFSDVIFGDCLNSFRVYRWLSDAPDGYGFSPTIKADVRKYDLKKALNIPFENEEIKLTLIKRVYEVFSVDIITYDGNSPATTKDIYTPLTLRDIYVPEM